MSEYDRIVRRAYQTAKGQSRLKAFVKKAVGAKTARPDTPEANSLLLHIENNYDLHKAVRNQEKDLMKALLEGKQPSARLMLPVVEKAAEGYFKEYAPKSWKDMFSADEIKDVATELTKYFLIDVKSGETSPDNYDLDGQVDRSKINPRNVRAMDQKLREGLIKLAYSNPDLRPHLLPLIKNSASFEDDVKGKKFKHPETGNDVKFDSLPAKEQTKVRKKWKKKNDGKGKDDKGGGGKLTDDQKKLKKNLPSKEDIADAAAKGERSSGQVTFIANPRDAKDIKNLSKGDEIGGVSVPGTDMFLDVTRSDSATLKVTINKKDGGKVKTLSVDFHSAVENWGLLNK